MREKATEKRDMARRARRLAATLSSPADQDRLQRYAAELDQEANELDRLAAAEQSGMPSTPPAGLPVRQVQQQQQQQEARPTDDDAIEPKSNPGDQA